MTKFKDFSNEPKKEKTETVFTHRFHSQKWWIEAEFEPK